MWTEKPKFWGGERGCSAIKRIMSLTIVPNVTENEKRTL